MGITPTMWVWHNGAFIKWEDATIHVISHVVHYGSSVFEGIRCYDTDDGPQVFRLNDHMQRFAASCRVYRMPLGYDVEALADACCDVVARNGLRAAYIRPIVLRGEGAIGVDPDEAAVETYIMCWPWGAYLGDRGLEQGIDACLSTWFRPAPNTHPTLAKCGGNYVNAQLMKMEARVNGYDEAIALAVDGTISEASAQNIFVVQDGVISTPPLDGSMLAGITRDCAVTLAKEADIPLKEERIPRERLYLADEVFLTGTASEITPVRSVDRIPVGQGKPGPVTQRLQRRLLDIAWGRVADPFGWRTALADQPKARTA